MTHRSATYTKRAAAIIVTQLRALNGQDHLELRAHLSARGIPDSYLHPGIRFVRDHYGENCLVKQRIPHIRRPVYVLDPTERVALDAFNENARRALAEAQHLTMGLDWMAKTYGNRGAIRSARRYAKVLIAELEDIIEATR